MKRFDFVVYGAPVPKQRARVARGHAFTPARTREWEKRVALCATEAMPLSWRRDGAAYALRVVVHRAARRGDLDNFVKCVSDALNRIAWDDDSRVVVLEARMTVDRDRPRVEVEIEEVAA